MIIGLLVILGYLAGLFAEAIGLPKITGYIITGILFSPNTLPWISIQILTNTGALLEVSLAFIAFEVGGELRWSRLKKQESKIIYITLLEGITPFILITVGFYFLFVNVPSLLPFTNTSTIFVFSMLLASLASPTDPATTLAIAHQYNARGPVKDTILGIAAHDDALGIFIFSLALAFGIYSLSTARDISVPLLFFTRHLGGGVLVGAITALILGLFLKALPKVSEGQWIVVIFGVIALCYGIATTFDADPVLSSMVMGIITVNTGQSHRFVFKIIRRYTEELIFLFFFVLSGLHLNIHTIPAAVLPIILYVCLRVIGKYIGSSTGARLAGASKVVQKYTFGGLIPQGGVVIGLTLLISNYTLFSGLFDLLLTVVMGATLINEIMGPLSAKYSLEKAGEIALPHSREKRKNKKKG